jgi:hypothetical protein
VKVGLWKGRQAFKTKLIVNIQHIAATAFAYMWKDKMEKRVFYFMKQLHAFKNEDSV